MDFLMQQVVAVVGRSNNYLLNSEKMKKQNIPEIILFGVLPISIVLFGFYLWKKPKKNKEGFYNATGGCGCGA